MWINELRLHYNILKGHSGSGLKLCANQFDQRLMAVRTELADESDVWRRGAKNGSRDVGPNLPVTFLARVEVCVNVAVWALRCIVLGEDGLDVHGELKVLHRRSA
jgi:hypothetical protein